MVQVYYRCQSCRVLMRVDEGIIIDEHDHGWCDPSCEE